MTIEFKDTMYPKKSRDIVAYRAVFNFLDEFDERTVLMLSQGLYWYKKANEEHDRDYFFKRDIDWTIETGIKDHSVKRARKVLSNLNVWRTEVNGVGGASRHVRYYLNEQVILSYYYKACKIREELKDG